MGDVYTKAARVEMGDVYTKAARVEMQMFFVPADVRSLDNFF